MAKNRTWQLLHLSAASLGIIGVSGCPDAPQSPLAQSSTSPPTLEVVQVDTPTARVQPASQQVPFTVCASLPDWQRPPLDQQMASLLSNPRYGEALHEESLKSLFEKFWNQSIIAFTTYGLSARVEPIDLSGVWTAIEQMDDCYVGDRPTAISQGELAELWLIGYEIVAITWVDDAYQMTVAPTSEGLQIVQFERQEQQATLPINVQETSGAPVALASGDG